MMAEKVLLTVAEAAERLGIGRSHTYGYVMRGELPSILLGRSRRISAAALLEFVRQLERNEVEGSLLGGPRPAP
jgi:excisionase family DNA binding protein